MQCPVTIDPCFRSNQPSRFNVEIFLSRDLSSSRHPLVFCWWLEAIFWTTNKHFPYARFLLHVVPYFLTYFLATRRKKNQAVGHKNAPQVKNHKHEESSFGVFTAYLVIFDIHPFPCLFFLTLSLSLPSSPMSKNHEQSLLRNIKKVSLNSPSIQSVFQATLIRQNMSEPTLGCPAVAMRT